MVDVDRGTGILTKKDRQYLRDLAMPDSRQAQYERKKGARQRIKSGLLDLPTIRFLPPEERRKLFGDMESGDDLYWALVNAVALAKHACDEAGLPIEDLLEEGLEIADFEPRNDLTDDLSEHELEQPTKVLTGIDIELEYEYADVYHPERLKERWEEGAELDDIEFRVLVESDVFDESDFQRLKDR